MTDSPISASVKIEVKTEVPAEASGRLVHAITDAVSPLTEYLGLVGDRVRIHRMMTVRRLIAKAEEQLALEKAEANPVPLKIAIPLLEHASQEEPDDEFMIDLWTKLLVSATRDDSISPRFITILSDLNGRQARLLKVIFDAEAYGLRKAYRLGREIKYTAEDLLSVYDKGGGAAYAEALSDNYIGRGRFPISIRLDSRNYPVHKTRWSLETLDPDLTILESLRLIDIEVD